jgi:hypothetical protein
MVGAELGSRSIPGESSSAAGGLGLLGAFGAIGVGAGLERRLAEKWWFVVNVSGSSASHESTLADSGDASSSSDRTSFFGSIGARYVANPADTVRVGGTVRIGGNVGSNNRCTSFTDEEISCTDTSTIGFHAEVDLVVGLALTDQLELRLSTTLVEAQVGSGEVTQTDQLDRNTSYASVAAALRPRLGLFVGF